MKRVIISMTRFGLLQLSRAYARNSTHSDRSSQWLGRTMTPPLDAGDLERIEELHAALGAAALCCCLWKPATPCVPIFLNPGKITGHDFRT